MLGLRPYAGLLALALLIAPVMRPVPARATDDAIVTLPGSGPVGLGDAEDLGDPGPAATVAVQFALRLRDQPLLERLSRDVNDPRSPAFGKFLTADQFAARFAPAPAELDQATAYLRASGLKVTSVSADRHLVDAEGSHSAVGKMLGTRLARFRDRHSGETFTSGTSAVSLPSSVARVVAAVHGLDSHARLRRAPLRPAQAPGAGPAGGYTPAQVRTAYGMASGALASFTGSGQTIGLFELDRFDPSHVATYDRQYFRSLPPAVTRVPIDGGAGRTPAGQVEVELDIEVAHALAPGAAVVVYDAPNTNIAANDAYSAMVAAGARTNSTSWGVCEAAQGSSETQTLHQIFLQAASMGEAFFAASGDAGAFDCYDPRTGAGAATLAVDSPASDPLVTGVGGTSLALNPDNTYAGESAWGGASVTQPQGSGGGNSSQFAQPSWQGAVHQPQNVSNQRQVPDVALDADPNTGYSIYTSSDSSGAQGGWKVVAGTSAASPAWAAFAAAYNQSACAAGHGALGNPNPQLYQVAGSTVYRPFNDVTTGNSGNPVFYPATSGWDYATGLGTLRGNDMARALAAASPGAPPGPQVTAVGNGAPPAIGPPLGGNQLDIYGCGFVNSANFGPPAVTFDGQPATSVTYIDGRHLRVIPPAHNGGTVDVAVSNPGGGTDTARSAYRYFASTGGYNILTGAGALYSFGDAGYQGNLLDHGYPGPAVGLAETPSGMGYNILTGSGGIYSFGDGTYAGNLIDHHYPGPAVSLSYTPTGGGYAILTRAGGFYSFGDAAYFGNLIDHGYPGPAVSLAYTPTGQGYVILTRAGAIYTFGDAQYQGNLLDHGYPGTAVSLNMTRSGSGYSILTSDGALYSFGDAPYYGNLIDHRFPGPAVAISDTP